MRYDSEGEKNPIPMQRKLLVFHSGDKINKNDE